MSEKQTVRIWTLAADLYQLLYLIFDKLNKCPSQFPLAHVLLTICVVRLRTLILFDLVYTL